VAIVLVRTTWGISHPSVNAIFNIKSQIFALTFWTAFFGPFGWAAGKNLLTNAQAKKLLETYVVNRFSCNAG